MSGDRNHRDESPVGSPAWAASTDGRLSRAQARQVRVGVLRDAVRFAESRLLLLLTRAAIPWPPCSPPVRWSTFWGRAWDDLRRDFVRAVLAAHPRDGFGRAMATAWRAEARAVPQGRAAVIDRTACFSLLARWVPPPD